MLVKNKVYEVILNVFEEIVVWVWVFDERHETLVNEYTYLNVKPSTARTLFTRGIKHASLVEITLASSIEFHFTGEQATEDDRDVVLEVLEGWLVQK
jgi:polyferredoxin